MVNLANELPISKVIDMRGSGMSDQDIASDLMSQGYSAQSASDAIGQADIKNTIEDDAPSPEMRPSVINEEAQEGEEVPPFQPEVQRPTSQPRSTYQSMVLPERSSSRADTELIEQIAESIIEEKWRKMIENVGDLSAFKENVSLNITAIKQELVRMQNRFDSLQRAVLGKISDYDTNLTDVGSEIKALEKVLQRIIEPLTSNIKDLQKITQELKSR